MTALDTRVSRASLRWAALRRAAVDHGAALTLPAIGSLVALVLLTVSAGYGFHRDELYFIVAGRHPALGYVDQPPLTPLLSAVSAAVLGVSPTAVRLLPALVAAAVVVLTGLMAREFGADRRGQSLAAITAAISGVLAEGHLDHTTTYDLLAWALILWLVTRLLGGADRRLWLAVGLVAGIGLENKDTPLFLGAGLAAGVLISRRSDVLRCGWTWAALALALGLWAPNLAWQAANGWPEIAMAHAIAGEASTNRALLLPMLLLFAGPLLFPVSVAGFRWLLLGRSAAPWRPLGIAFGVIVALVVVTGGKFYYAAAFVPVLIAAGAIVLAGWLARGHVRLRWAAFGAGGVFSGAIMTVLVLPILPPATLASTPIPNLYDASVEQIGWPDYVATVEHVVQSLPPAPRAHAAILTNNYAEAGALQLLGAGLPPVYSGHNSFWDWGPPPADRTTVVLVGIELYWWPAALFETCHLVATLDNGYGIRDQEQGHPVSVCTGLLRPWSEIWPGLRHVD
ncbi:MAG TPA: glycosyltransferase family 39 protein [Candidatus Limnocylindrales bacterium]